MTIFLPCRLGSERIPQKNTKDFAGIKGGLLKVKLNTLLPVLTLYWSLLMMPKLLM